MHSGVAYNMVVFTLLLLLFVGGYYGSGRRGGQVWLFFHCIGSMF